MARCACSLLCMTPGCTFDHGAGGFGTDCADRTVHVSIVETEFWVLQGYAASLPHVLGIAYSAITCRKPHFLGATLAHRGIVVAIRSSRKHSTCGANHATYDRG